jgi:hypothetical protein
MPPVKASRARMIVFFAAIVMISGKRSRKMSGSRKVSWSFCQSAVNRMTNSTARVSP